MALNTSELQRIKHELGFNQLNIGAEPYIGVTRYFEQIVLPNLNAGALTTSTTAIVSTGAPSPAVLTLANAAGFSMLDRAIIDVDDAQEEATIQAVTGSTIVVRLAKSHGDGTTPYPVSVEGGESIVRTYLRRLRVIADRIDRFGARAGVRKADEIEFFGASGRGGREKTGFDTLEQMQDYLRSELCKLLFGVGSIGQFGGAGGRVGIY